MPTLVLTFSNTLPYFETAADWIPIKTIFTALQCLFQIFQYMIFFLYFLYKAAVCWCEIFIGDPICAIFVRKNEKFLQLLYASAKILDLISRIWLIKLKLAEGKKWNEWMKVWNDKWKRNIYRMSLKNIVMALWEVILLQCL